MSYARRRPSCGEGKEIKAQRRQRFSLRDWSENRGAEASFGFAIKLVPDAEDVTVLFPDADNSHVRTAVEELNEVAGRVALSVGRGRSAHGGNVIYRIFGVELMNTAVPGEEEQSYASRKKSLSRGGWRNLRAA